MSTNTTSDFYQRIVYSPEVQVYILPGDSNTPIDISDDIISGSITRRTEALSTASFVVQSRRKQDNSLVLGSVLRPMDRIVVYLKKTKPILIFSGYLDLVPIFQAVPEPFTIEASCTLKRLEFTYWDPQLPNVVETLAQYGFTPTSNGNGGGLNWFLPPVAAARESGKTSPTEVGNGMAQDTGFGAMLHFLLTDVGGWDPKTIWIEPIPTAWMQRAALLANIKNDWDENYGTVSTFLKNFLTSGGSAGDAGGGGDASGGGSVLGADSIKEAIAASIKKYNNGDDVPTDLTPDVFIGAATKYGKGMDPRFLAAIAAMETNYGAEGQGRSPGKGGYYNCFGLGNTGVKFSSRAESVYAAAKQICDPSLDFYLNDHPNQTAKEWIVSWTDNDQAHLNRVVNAWKEMSTPDHPVDSNKSYSLEGQGLKRTTDFSATSGGAGATDPSRPGSSSPSSTPENKTSVRLEAGHTAPRQPGYRNASNEGEQVLNKAIIKEIVNLHKASAYKDKIDLNVSEGSTATGVNTDIYLSIHHDSNYATTRGKVGIPCPDSKKGEDAIVQTKNGADAGKPGPNKYGESGWVTPESVGGRASIHDDEGLQRNSKALLAFLMYESRTIYGSNDYEYIDVASNYQKSDNRVINYYGFYYSQAKACALIEMPWTDRSNPKRQAKIVWQAIVAYHDKWKTKNLQAGTGAGNAGDNSPASKLIELCGKVADFNERNGGPLKYDSPGARDVTLTEAMEKKSAMDCSGFFYNGMHELGIGSIRASDTTQLWEDSEKFPKGTEPVAGQLYIKGGATGTGARGHVLMYVGGNKCVHCSSSQNGPYFTDLDSYVDNETYELCTHKDIGTTTTPPTNFSGGSGSGSTPDAFLVAKNVAFNVAFNFPGSMLESLFLTGERALENDVKLLETIAEVCQASLRTFSSLPNGDFIAWYPDYFNLTNRNPWLTISPTEIQSCTISLSDKQLVTHVYVLGNPLGFGQTDTGTIQLELVQKMMGAGVVTIERPWVLDSFLAPFDDETDESTGNEMVKRPLPVLQNQQSAMKFLERYGARPYLEKIPTIRHPIFEFFYAYHTFIQKWAEQFVSQVELTFMPELFPGMIVQLNVRPAFLNGDKKGDTNQNITFYCKEVTHNFSYESGFTTSAVLIAPGTISEGGENDWALTLVRPPNIGDKEAWKKRKKVVKKKKTTANPPKTGNQRPTAGGGTTTDGSLNPLLPTDGEDDDG